MPRPANTTRDQLMTKIARIAMAIQKAGDDHIGSVETIHEDFQTVIRSLNLFDEDLRRRIKANAVGIYGTAYVAETPLDQLVREVAIYCFQNKMEECQLTRDVREALRFYDILRKDMHL